VLVASSGYLAPAEAGVGWSLVAGGRFMLAGDGAKLRAAYDELEARISTLEHKPS